MSKQREIDDDILVVGYIRQNIETVYMVSIPSAIQKLCHRFWGTFVCDEWDTEYFDPNGIEINREYVKCIGSSPFTVYGKYVVDVGYIFKWTIKIEEFYNNNKSASYHPYIGIVCDDKVWLNKKLHSKYWTSDKNGYLFTGSVKTMLRPGDKRYGKPFDKKGDIMEIKLDLINFTLRYSLNGNDFGIAFTDIEKHKYRIALTLHCGTGSIFRFL